MTYYCIYLYITIIIITDLFIYIFQVIQAGKEILSNIPGGAKKSQLGATSVAFILNIISKKILKWRKAQQTTTARDEAKTNSRNFASLMAVMYHTYKNLKLEGNGLKSSTIFNLDATGIVFNKSLDVDSTAPIGILKGDKDSIKDLRACPMEISSELPLPIGSSSSSASISSATPKSSDLREADVENKDQSPGRMHALFITNARGFLGPSFFFYTRGTPGRKQKTKMETVQSDVSRGRKRKADELSAASYASSSSSSSSTLPLANFKRPQTTPLASRSTFSLAGELASTLSSTSLPLLPTSSALSTLSSSSNLSYNSTSSSTSASPSQYPSTSSSSSQASSSDIPGYYFIPLPGVNQSKQDDTLTNSFYIIGPGRALNHQLFQHIMQHYLLPWMLAQKEDAKDPFLLLLDGESAQLKTMVDDKNKETIHTSTTKNRTRTVAESSEQQTATQGTDTDVNEGEDIDNDEKDEDDDDDGGGDGNDDDDDDDDIKNDDDDEEDEDEQGSDEEFGEDFEDETLAETGDDKDDDDDNDDDDDDDDFADEWKEGSQVYTENFMKNYGMYLENAPATPVSRIFKEANGQVLKLPANCSGRLQPLDLSIGFALLHRIFAKPEPFLQRVPPPPSFIKKVEQSLDAVAPDRPLNLPDKRRLLTYFHLLYHGVAYAFPSHVLEQPFAMLGIIPERPNIQKILDFCGPSKGALTQAERDVIIKFVHDPLTETEVAEKGFVGEERMRELNIGRDTFSHPATILEIDKSRHLKQQRARLIIHTQIQREWALKHAKKDVEIEKKQIEADKRKTLKKKEKEKEEKLKEKQKKRVEQLKKARLQIKELKEKLSGLRDNKKKERNRKDACNVTGCIAPTNSDLLMVCCDLCSQWMHAVCHNPEWANKTQLQLSKLDFECEDCMRLSQ